jgi:hypothetical protein
MSKSGRMGEGRESNRRVSFSGPGTRESPLPVVLLRSYDGGTSTATSGSLRPSWSWVVVQDHDETNAGIRHGVVRVLIALAVSKTDSYSVYSCKIYNYLGVIDKTLCVTPK